MVGEIVVREARLAPELNPPISLRIAMLSAPLVANRPNISSEVRLSSCPGAASSVGGSSVSDSHLFTHLLLPGELLEGGSSDMVFNQADDFFSFGPSDLSKWKRW